MTNRLYASRFRTGLVSARTHRTETRAAAAGITTLREYLTWCRREGLRP